LKDDGVDIVPLQDFKVSSRSITIAVLAQATVHKQYTEPQARLQPSSTKQLDTPETKKDEGNARRAPNDSLFSYLEYRPRRNPPLKPKRYVSSDLLASATSRSHYTGTKDEPPAKRQCTIDLRVANHNSTIECEEEIPAWNALRRKNLTDIFKLSPYEGQLAKDSARITTTFPSKFTTGSILGGLELKSKGYGVIMLDLYALRNTVDPHGTLTIYDLDDPTCTIIKGSAETLAGLVLRLRTPGIGLANMAKCFSNEEGVRQARGRVYELSNKTQGEFATIEEALDEGKDTEVS
jgi:hypothetical protein